MPKFHGNIIVFGLNLVSILKMCKYLRIFEVMIFIFVYEILHPKFVNVLILSFMELIKFPWALIRAEKLKTVRLLLIVRLN